MTATLDDVHTFAISSLSVIRRAVMVAMVMAAAGVHAQTLRMIAPSSQTVLRGGHFVTLQWEADALGKDVEEWEAFASIDGGRYYSVRLTPHLDIAIQRFEV